MAVARAIRESASYVGDAVGTDALEQLVVDLLDENVHQLARHLQVLLSLLVRRLRRPATLRRRSKNYTPRLNFPTLAENF